MGGTGENRRSARAALGRVPVVHGGIRVEGSERRKVAAGAARESKAGIVVGAGPAIWSGRARGGVSTVSSEIPRASPGQSGKRPGELAAVRLEIENEWAW